tara:strand:- start:283 stop:510 length:228 start_codon:yes stop_codon:yes gene_type:complete
MLELVRNKLKGYKKVPVEENEQVYEEESFNIQELGYLLQIVTNGRHEGNVLELALTIKRKLQDKIDKLMNNKEAL